MQSLENIQLLLGGEIEPALVDVDECWRGDGCPWSDQGPVGCVGGGSHGHRPTPETSVDVCSGGLSGAGEQVLGTGCLEQRTGGEQTGCMERGAQHRGLAATADDGCNLSFSNDCVVVVRTGGNRCCLKIEQGLLQGFLDDVTMTNSEVCYVGGTTSQLGKVFQFQSPQQ